MSSFKIGEASWDEEDVSTRPTGDRKKIPYLKMEYNKSYRVRIVSQPFRYYAKWVKLPNGKQAKLNSSLTEDCPLNADGKEISPGWYARVLSYEGTKVVPAVLDFGKQIMKAIKAVQANPDYGKQLHTYVITITKGAKGTQPLYTVLPSPPKVLTDEEKDLAKKMNKEEIDGKPNPDFINLAERCKALPVETLRKILAGEAKTPEVAEATEAAENAEVKPDEAGLFEEEAAPTPTPVVEKPAAKAAVKTEKAAAPKAKKDDEDFLDF